MASPVASEDRQIHPGYTCAKQLTDISMDLLDRYASYMNDKIAD
jgi:hypothetical protein